MQYITNIFNAVVNFQETNQYIDLIVMMLVLLGGYFAKEYLSALNWNMALKTLLVSTIAVVLYTLILKFSEQSLPLGYMKKAFISYAIATSLYEIIIKHLAVGLNLIWANTLERFSNNKSAEG